ncbi:hypothetical protein O3P69_011390 [Scylla paramamosain]|uniref:Reverse transcriptase domain-containing protein n=1 Tax=Scylla paramamosain TaxID=85552 RepID=A0AAW0T676_SCYPA
MAFIDLKSAFDVVNRDIILDQLMDIGINWHLRKWIRGYLSNRSSRVFFHGVYSSSRGLSLGTPQASPYTTTTRSATNVLAGQEWWLPGSVWAADKCDKSPGRKTCLISLVLCVIPPTNTLDHYYLNCSD